MIFPTFRSQHAVRPSVRVAAFVAVALVLTGFETVTHGHVPALAGWHDASPHGTASHDDGLRSCSICRLAHESSSPAIVPLDASRPDRVELVAPADCVTVALSVLARERSPRAPPPNAAC